MKKFLTILLNILFTIIEIPLAIAGACLCMLFVLVVGTPYLIVYLLYCVIYDTWYDFIPHKDKEEIISE